MLRRFYDQMIAMSASPHALWVLAFVAFAESSVFPIPPDVMLVPMTVARPRSAYLYAAVCTIASVLGGLAGYAIGALLFDTVGQWLVALYGMEKGMAEFRAMYAHWGAWIILLKGLTPIPLKLVTITSGFAGYDLVSFIFLSLLTRGLRFFVLAGILNRYGVPIRRFMEAHLGLVTAGLAIVVVGGFVVVRYLI
jgi:membrane protein YqaA with SNARE-associated domain